MDEATRLFNKKVAPSLRLATRIGPQHTAATYTNLTSLLIHKGESLLGKTINVYSYGSGAASTMYRLKVKRLPGFVEDMHERLDKRCYLSAGAFDKIMDEYADTYARFNWSAKVHGSQPGGAYYLRDCDKWGRRAYYQVKDPVYWKLPGPFLNEPPPRRTKEEVEAWRMTLPEGLRDLPEFLNYDPDWDPTKRPEYKEPTRDELIAAGFREEDLGPDPNTPQPQQLAAAFPDIPDLSGIDHNALAGLLQLLAQQEQDQPPPPLQQQK